MCHKIGFADGGNCKRDRCFLIVAVSEAAGSVLYTGRSGMYELPNFGGERRRIRIPAPVNWTLAVGVTVSLGTFWEVFEFTIDHTGLFYSQRGLADTMFDLVADTVGATAVASLGIVIGGRRTPAVP